MDACTVKRTEHPLAQNFDMNLCDVKTIHQESMADENNDTETDEEFAETDTNEVSASIYWDYAWWYK